MFYKTWQKRASMHENKTFFVDEEIGYALYSLLKDNGGVPRERTQCLPQANTMPALTFSSRQSSSPIPNFLSPFPKQFEAVSFKKRKYQGDHEIGKTTKLGRDFVSILCVEALCVCVCLFVLLLEWYIYVVSRRRGGNQPHNLFFPAFAFVLKERIQPRPSCPSCHPTISTLTLYLHHVVIQRNQHARSL